MNHRHAKLLTHGQTHARRHAIEGGDRRAEIRITVFTHRQHRPRIAGVDEAERMQRVDARLNGGDVNWLHISRPHVHMVIMLVMVMAVVMTVVVMAVMTMTVVMMAVMMATMATVAAAECGRAAGRQGGYRYGGNGQRPGD
jgi:Flp pilus assembly protein TadB